MDNKREGRDLQQEVDRKARELAGGEAEAHDGGGMAGMMRLGTWPWCNGQMGAWSARLHGPKGAGQGGTWGGQWGKGAGPSFPRLFYQVFQRKC